MSNNTKIECCTHSKYNGRSAPKTDCICCWKIYATKLKLTNTKLRKHLRESLYGEYE